MLAAMENSVYTTATVSLGAGDMIFNYTDGVTEAMDKQGQFFTGATLADTLKQTVGMSADQTVNTALAKIHEFASGAEQSDDITMMAIQYSG